MDFFNKQAEQFMGGKGSGKGSDTANSTNIGRSDQQSGSSTSQDTSGGGGFLSGITNKINSAAGGGKESEKNEDGLDKAIDYVQEKFMGGGDQSNESAMEQAKDEKISDFIRGQYKSTTGKDVPIKDKPTAFDRSTD